MPEAIEPQGICTGERGCLKVLFIGESTFAGVGVATHEEGFAGTLAKELCASTRKTIDWRVYARSGYTAKKVTEKILPKITESSANLIIVGLGGNDAFMLNSPRKWEAEVRELITNLKAKFGHTPIVFANMPPIKEFPAFTAIIKFSIGNLVEILGAALAEVVKEFENVYCNSEVLTLKEWIKKLNISANQTDFFSDGVHPSKLTYQSWGKDLSIFILNQKAIKKFFG